MTSPEGEEVKKRETKRKKREKKLSGVIGVRVRVGVRVRPILTDFLAK